MKIEYFPLSIRFLCGRVKTFILTAVLILCASLTVDYPALLSETLPRSLTVLYSNNINAEIDPCPV